MKLSHILRQERILTGRQLLHKFVTSYHIRKDSFFRRVNERSWKERLHKVREFSIQNLSRLKTQAISRLSQQNIKVYEVKGRGDFYKLLFKLIPPDVKVVKSKSNVMSELGVAKRLKRRNKLIETDIGDFIIDLCDEMPSHPILPAFHIPIEKIVAAIRRKFHCKVVKNDTAIVSWVRKYIKKQILHASIGLTGANAVSADGAIFIVENEGNISLVSKIPSKHIIVTGIDKIVPTTQDAMLVCQAAAVWGTGSLPAYINVITSPSKTSDIRGKTVWGAQATREVHLIFVDNGRSQVIAQGFEQLLWCIGCGACLYLCPIYDQILNHYGSLYLGGRGIGMCVFQENMQQAFEKGLYFCTTCQACKTNCPLELDIPQLLKQLRVRAINYKLETPTNQEMLRCIRRAGNPFGRLKPSEIPKKLFCC